MRHVNLDPVSAMVELLPRRLPRLDRAVDNLRAFGHVEFRSIAFERITARGRNGAGRDEQSWPRNIALIDGLFDAHITVAGAFGFYVAQRRETLFQCSPRRNRSPCRT